MNPQHDGDELFDFDLLQENDYCQTPGAISYTYAINNLENKIYIEIMLIQFPEQKTQQHITTIPIGCQPPCRDRVKMNS